MEWMNDDEYCKLTGLHMSIIDDMVESGKLNVRVEDGVRLIDSSVGATEIIVPQNLKNSHREIFMRCLYNLNLLKNHRNYH